MNTTTNTTIKTGIIQARSICDADCVFTAEVFARKGAFATVKAQGIERRVKIFIRDGVEFIYALGKYSMCPIFRASTQPA